MSDANTITVYEFTRGFKKIEREDGILVSGGYESEVGPSNYQVPKEIQDAVKFNDFRIPDSYAPAQGEIALIARDIGDYSVLAVATYLLEDGKRPGVAYRYFWLDRGNWENIDGIGTLLWWWRQVGEPYFSFEEYEKFNRLNYYAPICTSEVFARCRPQVESLLPKITYVPYIFALQNNGGNKTPDYAGLHYLALHLKQQRQTPMAWAWNVPHLDFPERFTLICCADGKAFEYISPKVKQYKRPLASTGGGATSNQQQQKLPGAAGSTGQFSTNPSPKSNNNLTHKIKECIKNIANDQNVEENLLKLADYLESYSTSHWNWAQIIDNTFKTNNTKSAAKYQALLVLLNPQENVYFWLSWLTNPNNSNWADASLKIQSQLLKVCKDNQNDNAYKYLSLCILRCISLLLVKCLSHNINDREYQNIEWLLVDSKNVWSSQFKTYAINLTSQLKCQDPNDAKDQFYEPVLNMLNLWKSQLTHNKPPQVYKEYSTIARLVEKIGNYTLSAFFYQLSEGSVPTNVYDLVHLQIIPLTRSEKASDLYNSERNGLDFFSKVLSIVSNNRLSVIIAIILAVVAGYLGVSAPNWLNKSKNDPPTEILLSPNLERDWYYYSQQFIKQTTEKDKTATKNQIIKYLKELEESIKNSGIEPGGDEDRKKLRSTPDYTFISGSFAAKLPKKLDLKKPQDILLLQKALSSIDILKSPPSGNYDDQTKDGVNQFQKMREIPETGTVDEKTWNQLSQLFIDEQVQIAATFLLKSIETRNSHDDLKKDKDNLFKCKKNNQSEGYIMCVEELIQKLEPENPRGN